MWNEPTKERLAKVPKMYSTENTPLMAKDIHLHFFIGGCDWYVAEYDGEDTFFGYAILNNDLQMAEWGYVRLSELRDIKRGVMEIDCELERFFPITKAIDIPKIAGTNSLLVQ